MEERATLRESIEMLRRALGRVVGLVEARRHEQERFLDSLASPETAVDEAMLSWLRLSELRDRSRYPGALGEMLDHEFSELADRLDDALLEVALEEVRCLDPMEEAS